MENQKRCLDVISYCLAEKRRGEVWLPCSARLFRCSISTIFLLYSCGSGIEEILLLQLKDRRWVMPKGLGDILWDNEDLLA